MNRTKIEWTDFTFNPVTGCWGPGGTAEKPNRCPYCYANSLTKRFNRGTSPVFDDLDCRGPGYNDPFKPFFYPEHLSQPAKVKNPSKIFVCSMADLFGNWVPDEWIEAILRTVRDNPRHTFQFLTKNPARYQEFNPWPKNCWLGATVTNQPDADERIPELLKADATERFVSVEPLLGPIQMSKSPRNGWLTYPGHKLCENPGIKLHGVDWLIIGAQTGPGAVEYKSDWVKTLISQARASGVPLFLKENLKWPEKIQEWPNP